MHPKPQVNELIVGDALQFLHIGDALITVPGKAKRHVQRGDVHREGVVPGVDVVLVMDAAVVALLLPYELGVLVGDGVVAVVLVFQSLYGRDCLVLTVVLFSYWFMGFFLKVIPRRETSMNAFAHSRRIRCSG